MAHRFDANEMINSALSLRPMGDGAYQVQLGRQTVGEIMVRRRSFGRRVWFWSLSGPQLPASMNVAGSNAQTLEGAKAAVKAAFDMWLEAATGRRGDVRWSSSKP